MNNTIKRGFMALFIMILLCLTVMSVSATDLSNDSLISNDNTSNIIIGDDSDNILVNNNLNSNDNILTSKLNDDPDTLYSNDVVEILGATQNINGNTFNDIQTTITNSKDGDVIYLGNTTFTGDKLVINVDKQVTIDGSINGGSETSILDAKELSGIFNITADNVIIKNVILVNGKSHLIGGILWDGLNGTVINSKFINNSAQWGGAIAFPKDKASVINCTFIKNSAVDDGGAIYWFGKDGTVLNSKFINNSADYGGAIAIHGNNLTLSDSNFINNSAINLTKGGGGAIYWFGNNGNLTNSNFSYNNAIISGGSIYWFGDNGTIKNSSFIKNQVTDTSTSNGGAISWFGENGNLINSTFTENHALNGGAIHWYDDNGTIIDSKFYNNTADNGGAIKWGSVNGLILNSSFINNSADYGGAIYFYNWDNIINNINNNVIINNSSFKYNKAGYGSAIYNPGLTGKDLNLHIKNTNFYQNQALSNSLDVIVNPINSIYPSDVKINTVFFGGDNIVNAIFNTGDLDKIYFSNITYEAYINGALTNHSTSINEVNPINGAENSNNGALLYQDSRENAQIINVTLINQDTGKVILDNIASITDIYGNIGTILSNLSPGNYNVTVTHNEDNYYTYISNSTLFTIEEGTIPTTDLTGMETVNNTRPNYGDIVNWIITISNYGPDKSTNVIVNDLLPNGLVYLNSTATRGNYDENTGSWVIGDLLNGETVSLTITSKINRTGNITNIANLTAKEYDTNLTNNFANATVNINPVIDLIVNKTVNNTKPLVNDTVDWVITIINNGPNNATGIIASDLLPECLIYINSIASKGSYDPVNGVWTIDNLDVGESLTLHIITSVNKANTTIINNVTVSANEKDINISNNFASVNITVPETNIPGNDTEDKNTTNNTTVNDNISTPTNNDLKTSVLNTNEHDNNLNNGINMKTTGNPVFILLLILAILSGIIPYSKRK